MTGSVPGYGRIHPTRRCVAAGSRAVSAMTSTDLGLSQPSAGPLPYREFIGRVARRAGLDFDDARSAVVGTVTALLRILGPADRERLLEVVPADLCEAAPAVLFPDSSDHRRTGTRLEVALDDVTHRALEHARHRAWAVLSLLTECRRPLMASLDLPPDVRALTGPPASTARWPSSRAAVRLDERAGGVS
jgi:hypothetical protein